MKNLLWLSVLLLGCLALVRAEDTCSPEEVDDKVYLFYYGYSWKPFEYLNDDGELMGLGYDITRTICKRMKKKCEHAVYYDYFTALNLQGVSIPLNDKWGDAIVNWIITPSRLASYSFSDAFAEEPAAYLYVRSNNGFYSLDELKRDAERIGFRKDWRTHPACLEKGIGIDLEGKVLEYDSVSALEAALQNEEVDVIFLDEKDIQNKNGMRRMGTEPIRCGSGGIATMFRKDMASMFKWYNEGLAEIRAKGDYKWLCNLNSKEHDPRCYED